MATHWNGASAAGALLAAQAVFQVADVAVSAFGVVILPKVAEMHSRGETTLLEERLNDLTAFILHIGIFLSLRLMIWSEPIVGSWLGPGYAHAVDAMRILAIGVTPYIAYTMLRSVIDGIEARPVNTLNLGVALAVVAGASWAAAESRSATVGLAWACVLGLWTVGVLSIRFVAVRYRLRFNGMGIGPSLLLNAILVVPSILTLELLGRQLDGLLLLGNAALVEGTLLLLYLAALRRMRARWLEQLMSSLGWRR
jgi:O-antigen/teichoic acid export membrane protein